MIQRLIEILNSLFLSTPVRGTPENPEVLDLEGKAKEQDGARVTGLKMRLVLTLIGIMIMVSVPAVLAVSSVYWIASQGLTTGSFLAWIAFFLVAPIALVLSLLAVVLDVLLLTTVIATLRGRSVIHLQFGRATHHQRTVNTYRDVTPPTHPLVD